MSVEKNIVLALKQVYDPEIPVNVYDLGLIYEIKVEEDGKASIQNDPHGTKLSNGRPASAGCL